MSVNQAWAGDVPSVTPETAPFWEACNQRRFVLQRCRDCDKVQYHYRAHCSHCFSQDIEDFDSTGIGAVWTYSVVHRNSSAAYRDKLPYVVATIELEGGVKVLGNVVGGDPDAIEIGTPVRVDFARSATGQMIPIFVTA